MAWSQHKLNFLWKPFLEDWRAEDWVAGDAGHRRTGREKMERRRRRTEGGSNPRDLLFMTRTLFIEINSNKTLPQDAAHSSPHRSASYRLCRHAANCANVLVCECDWTRIKNSSWTKPITGTGPEPMDLVQRTWRTRSGVSVEESLLPGNTPSQTASCAALDQYIYCKPVPRGSTAASSGTRPGPEVKWTRLRLLWETWATQWLINSLVWDESDSWRIVCVFVHVSH